MEKAAARRSANFLFGLALATFLVSIYVGLVFWNNTIDLGAKQVARIDFYQWVIVLSAVFLALLLGLLILFFLPSRRSASAPALVHVSCAACGADFDVSDPGMRPLGYDCPTCGTPGEIGGSREREAMVVTPPGESIEHEAPTSLRSLEAGAEALLVKCTNCDHEFELPYTEERPIVGTCPSCGQEAVLEEGEAVLHGGGPEVLEIEGIGPAYAKRLAAAGIVSTEQLRAADAQRLSAQTRIPQGEIEAWQAMADLLRVRGIGKQFAELLARAGVRTVDELARETPARLVGRLKAYVRSLDQPPTKSGVDEKRARRWIQAAKKGDFDISSGAESL